MAETHRCRMIAGDGAGPSSASNDSTATAVDPDSRWLDGAVQQSLKLCSSVDLVYKLLIQDIHPVLGVLPSLSPGKAVPCEAVVLCYM